MSPTVDSLEHSFILGFPHHTHHCNLMMCNPHHTTTPHYECHINTLLTIPISTPPYLLYHLYHIKNTIPYSIPVSPHICLHHPLHYITNMKLTTISQFYTTITITSSHNCTPHQIAYIITSPHYYTLVAINILS